MVLDAAARLKEAAEPGTVVADERTRRVAGPGFEFGAGRLASAQWATPTRAAATSSGWPAARRRAGRGSRAR